MEDDRQLRAKKIIETFELFEGIYLIGSLQTGVTVYNQQVRAHNLVWAMKKMAESGGNEPSSVAVVGGGISGVTAAACLHSMFPDLRVTIFEKQWELCPLQLGSDNRWVHPRIYDWPDPGSRAPSSGLPLLNWGEGRASDVARQVISGFADTSVLLNAASELYLGTRHLKISHHTKEIEWLGTRTELESGFLQFSDAAGDKQKFDAVILATGFGIERTSSISEAGSYWQNERLAQPSFDGRRTNYLISGYGDGALVDLARLRISRFRQDTVVYELFPGRIDQEEDRLCELKQRMLDEPDKAFDILAEAFDGPLERLVQIIRQRLRSDTSVVMHLSGSPNDPKTSISSVFSGSASFLNKLIFFALYRAGGFTPYFGTLKEASKEYGIERRCVLIRHGTDPVEVLRNIFHDTLALNEAVCEMRTKAVQTQDRSWAPGSYRTS